MAAGTDPVDRCGERIARLLIRRRPARRIIPIVSPIRHRRRHEAEGHDPGKARSRRSASGRSRIPPIAWAGGSTGRGPGCSRDTLDRLAELYGPQTWQRRLDPTSELILTILTQNTADIERRGRFEALRPAYPSAARVEHHEPGAGWGGDGLPDGRAPDWARRRGRAASTSSSTSSGRAGCRTRRRRASRRRSGRSARSAATTRWSSSATCPPLEARDWLTTIHGIGKKTASVAAAVLLRPCR